MLPAVPQDGEWPADRSLATNVVQEKFSRTESAVLLRRRNERSHQHRVFPARLGFHATCDVDAEWPDRMNGFVHVHRSQPAGDDHVEARMSLHEFRSGSEVDSLARAAKRTRDINIDENVHCGKAMSIRDFRPWTQSKHLDERNARTSQFGTILLVFVPVKLQRVHAWLPGEGERLLQRRVHEHCNAADERGQVAKPPKILLRRNEAFRTREHIEA